MPNLKFKQLLILSNSTRSANQFEFHDSLNLITANDNSVGKSTLVKLLFWTVGCEPSFDTKWDNLDCKTIVRFKINKSNYEVMRYKDLISLKEKDSDYVHFTKVSGEFSVKMSEILGFKAFLPNRKTGILENPPPAFYFLPFYIDQVKSWATAWNNFEKLGQYDKWKSTIIKYHVGLLTPKHFELDIKKNEKKEMSNQVAKLDTALEIVGNYTPKISNSTISSDKFELMTSEIKNDLNKLASDQESALEERTSLEVEVAYLNHQKNISEKIILELDKDYDFSIENVLEDEIECPLCGIVHENSVINRVSIMTDKIQAENQLKAINFDLNAVKNRLTSSSDKLEKTRARISEINEKYSILEDGKIIPLNDIIENIAGNSIKNNVIESKKEKLDKESKLQKDIRGIQKELKTILTSEDIQNINGSFISTFASYVQILNAEAVNLSAIKSPLDYNKVIKEGGAAEGSRAILAYYLTIFSMVEKYGHEVKSPLVIDTPNQQEQSHTNYGQIVDLITNKISKDSQVILCAMENQQLEPFKKKAKTILLKEGKLLDKEKYDEVKAIFDSIQKS